MVHQSEDQLFKYATKEDGFGLLKLLKESNANIKEIDFESENLTYNLTELVELDPKIYKTDMILELDHLIVLTEFQSTIVKTIDEKRYRLYTALVDYAKRNNKPLILIVISTAEKTKIKEYKINKDCVFTIPIVSLKDFDGDKIINNIENKVVFSKDEDAIWICRNCGHVVIGKYAPEVCPVCNHPQSFFELKSENY